MIDGSEYKFHKDRCNTSPTFILNCQDAYQQGSHTMSTAAVYPPLPQIIQAPSPITLSFIFANNPLFLEAEANVNAIWNGIFNQHFHYTHPNAPGNAYFIAPEGQAPDGKAPQRADLLISLLRLDGFAYKDIIPVLYFEGKSSKTASNIEAISLQMDKWLKNSKTTTKGLKIYSVAARGRKCWFYYMDAGSSEIRMLNIRNTNDKDHGTLSQLQGNNKHEMYDVVDDYDLINYAVRWIAFHPNTPPGKTWELGF
ncbi:hypothetical protein BGZ60DRAFT_419137 [Tricladium varicosporioides]|nr:hypothetical protein BGZ60DRAFT_419137 [Hymenoscyphus varicosporioides]